MQNPAYFAHESAYIEPGAQIGVGTLIWHFCHIMPGCQIGQNCRIGQNVVIHPGVILGNNLKIQNNVSIYSGVICEDDVFLGPSMVFTNVLQPRSFIDRRAEFKTTRIKLGASIGANATILCGLIIGRYALIGAGAVITKDVPDYALVCGNPAWQQGWVCKCGLTLDFEEKRAVCRDCQTGYQKINSTKITEIG